MNTALMNKIRRLEQRAPVVVKRSTKPVARPQAPVAKPVVAKPPVKPPTKPLKLSDEEKAARIAASLENDRKAYLAAKARRFERTGQAIALLRETFPALFAPGSPIRPLKKYIHKDVERSLPDCHKKSIRAALAFFTGNRRFRRCYLEAVAQGGQRYGLDGKPAGEITPEEQERAKQRLIG